MEEQVKTFQKHIGSPEPEWPIMPRSAKVLLHNEAMFMKEQSEVFHRLFLTSNNQIYLRLELIYEELAEVLDALEHDKKLETLDGLVDLAYVVVGTATQFKLPFDEAFKRVHAANMTKTSAAARHDGNKGKTEGFKPADLSDLV